jgi:hypothetical protein
MITGLDNQFVFVAEILIFPNVKNSETSSAVEHDISQEIHKC